MPVRPPLVIDARRPAADVLALLTRHDGRGLVALRVVASDGTYDVSFRPRQLRKLLKRAKLKRRPVATLAALRDRDTTSSRPRITRALSVRRLPKMPVAFGTAGDEPETRTLYAVLDMPVRVAPKERFKLTIGLDPTLSESTASTAMILPTALQRITAVLQAPGFRRADRSKSRQFELELAAGSGGASLDVDLIAPAKADLRIVRVLFYDTEGRELGHGARSIVIGAAVLPKSNDAHAVLEVPETTAPDLTITLGEHKGELDWSLVTPHTTLVDVRPLGGKTDLGDGAERFVQNLVAHVNGADNKEGIHDLLRGKGDVIAEVIAPGVFDALRLMKEHLGRTPNVKLTSSEPHVPWELALFPAPLLDPDAPPFLGAQVNLARWVVSAPSAVGDAPPARRTIGKAAVLAGHYGTPMWPQLPDADLEADEVASRFGATKADASLPTVLKTLKSSADHLHFTGHGTADATRIAFVCTPQDGKTVEFLLPDSVRAQRPLGGAPFVFINACNIGVGAETLGSYGGMAAAFLRAGAAGVLMPLWRVNDVVARDISKQFYDLVIDQMQTVTEALREVRKRFVDTSTSATPMAYVLYADPSLTLAKGAAA